MTGQPDKHSERRGRVWLWLVIAALVGGVGYRALVGGVGYRLLASSEPHGDGAPSAARSPASSVPVVVAKAHIGDIPIYLNGLGSVAASNKVTVRSRVDGQLISVAFQEGQLVHEGDLLAQIDPRSFEVQLAQAQGQLARDVAQLDSAKVNLARFRDLVTSKLIAKQQVDDQASLVGQLEGSVRTDQALIDNAKLQLSYSRITAPISGRIGLRLVDVGNIVHINDQNGLFVITQVQPIAVLFSVPADNLAAILPKLTAKEQLSVAAYDRAGQIEIAHGTLLTVDNQIDQSTGTARLKAIFPNEDGALFPNQFVNVRLLLAVQKGVIVIPSTAIQRGPQGDFVYIVKDDQTADVRTVTVGAATSADTAISAGLAVGEVVVVDGIDKLRAGSAVRIQSTSSQTAPQAKPAT